MIIGFFIGLLVYWFVNRNKKERLISTQSIPLSALALVPDGPTATSYPVKISRVKDGDTLVLEYIQLPWRMALVNVDLRCLGYDAPEVTRKRKSVHVTNQELELGKKAKTYLEYLVADSAFAYVDPEGRDRDNYGRILGRLYLRKNDGTLLNVSEEMIKLGYVRAVE